MKRYNQLFKQTSLFYSVLGSRNLSQRVLLEYLHFQVPIPKLLLLKVATDATSSPPNTAVREYLPFNKIQAQVSEQRETAVFHIQKKEGKRRREKGKVFKFRYLLTETQKKHTYRHHVGRNPSSQGCGALLPASICLKLHKSFLPLSHAHRSVLKITLNCQPKCMSGLMKV